MKRILVAVDDSETSLRAVRLAAEIATATKSELILAHVLVPPQPRSLWPGDPGVSANPANRAAAMSSNVDLVVVGSRGRGAAARVLLGSTSDRLVHICEKPVLIVH